MTTGVGAAEGRAAAPQSREVAILALAQAWPHPRTRAALRSRSSSGTKGGREVAVRTPTGTRRGVGRAKYSGTYSGGEMGRHLRPPPTTYPRCVSPADARLARLSHPYHNTSIPLIRTPSSSRSPPYSSPSIINTSTTAAAIRTRQEFRAAAMEFLFSKLSPRLVFEAECAFSAVFGDDRPSSRDLISVHLRFGDKTEMDRKAEMDPLPIAKYIDAVKRLAEQRNISKPSLYVASEGKGLSHNM